jgi:hypothetical protein
MAINRILRSAARLFVELPETPEMPGQKEMSPQQIADLLRDAPATPLPPEAHQAAASGAVDLPEIYRMAGVPPTAASIEEVAGLVEKYGDLDRETARRAVRTALEFRPGVTLKEILTDGALKLQAMQSYEEAANQEIERLRQGTTAQIEAARTRAEQTVAELEQRIAETKQQADAEVEALNQALAEREQAQAALMQRLEAEATQLHATLDFLTPDTPPSGGAFASDPGPGGGTGTTGDAA